MNTASTPSTTNSDQTLEQQLSGFDPTDPLALAAFEKAALVEDKETQQDDTAAADKADAGATSGAETSSAPQDKPQGVQAKDGKHVIPYAVLERERDQRARAEAALRQLTAEREALLQQKGGSGGTGGAGDEAGQGTLSDEDIQQLEDDFPSLAKVFKAQREDNQRLKAQLDSLAMQADLLQNKEAVAAQDEIEAAINAHPELVAWQAAANRAENPDPTMWNRVADMDEVLKKDPAFKDASLTERFEKAVASVKAIYGDGKAASAASTGATNASAATEQTPDAKALQAMAEAKLKAIAKAPPATLSDLPSGEAPAGSEFERLANASPAAIGNRFAAMSLEQIEAELARLNI